MVKEARNQLQTGFVGTPYLLHVLSDYGYAELAYTLLLRKEYPSWLYPVTKGATTIWEHWDGIMEDGNFWSSDMNSYNHYAYGSVADWGYMVAAGINTVDDLINKSEEEMLKVRNLGKKSFDEVREKLQSLGFDLASEED